MATHSSVVAQRILWTEEPGGLWSTGLQRVGHNWSDLACMHATTYLRLLIFLPAILIPACDSFSPAFHMMYSGKPLQSWKKPSERTAERSSSHWGREAFCPAAWSSTSQCNHSSEETDAPEFSCVVNTVRQEQGLWQGWAMLPCWNLRSKEKNQGSWFRLYLKFGYFSHHGTLFINVYFLKILH